MEIRALARAVLLGTTLADKLLEPDAAGLTDAAPGEALDAPDFPGRPTALGVAVGAHANARAAFPDEAALGADTGRGRLLHFFANHELLAMELMALVLLKFPEAPPAFRAGLARTIGEEQAHMRLYLERMQRLGVGFGELPLSRFFWDAMSGCRSPLEFVVQMSLTFEQANLDFSAYYRDAVARAGDAETAALLDRVYREEIGHVKHGVTWFNRWREDAGESDWDAYRRLLPAPLSPRRARGLSYQEDARREAGLSETFIRALAFCGGSRGRPRVVWHYNPLCEAEIARGSAGLVPPASRRRVIEDLEHVPMFLADPQDVVLTARAPRLGWLEELARAGFAVPELARPGHLPDAKLGGLEPWGWSPDAVRRFAPLARRLTATPGGNADWARGVLARGAGALAPLYSKAWSVAFWRAWLEAHPEQAPVLGTLDDAGMTHRDAAAVQAHARALLAAGRGAMLKAPLGTAGTQARRVTDAADLDPGSPGAGWVAKRLTEQGALIVEPYLDRVADLSLNLHLDDAGVRLVGLRRFITGPRFEYRGTYLGSAKAGFTAAQLRFLHEEGAGGRPVERLEEIGRAVGACLRDAGLQGNVGLDAMIWRGDDGTLKLRAVVEVNPRWTMGRVALAIERRMGQGKSGAWLFVPVRLRDRALELAAQHAPDVVWTSDPEAAQEVLTVLTVGDAATRAMLELIEGDQIRGN